MVGYPNGMKKKTEKAAAHNASRRGMSLEEDLNIANLHYFNTDKAVIYKKPTPVQIVHVDYPSRNKAKITEAYFRNPSTTDYNGIYKGSYIDFEAKEIRNKTLFPLSLIHKHQLNHLFKVEQQGAISFVIIRFSSYNETYLIFTRDLINHLENKDIKSLTLKWIKDRGYLCEYQYHIPCDYLKIVEQERLRRLKQHE